ncbi:PQQ-binding-like beta-propeller repeat protein [Stieleria marina]
MTRNSSTLKQLLATTLGVTALLMLDTSAYSDAPTAWPQWRGSAQNGVATGTHYPTQWNEESNIDWKTEIPGLGGSTPVTHDNVAYLTSGMDGKNKLMAIDTESGTVKWEIEIGDDTGNKHKKGGGSNPSAITDGELIYAFFRSGDLGCVDKNGKLKWQTQLSYDMKDGLWWDLGTSPILTDNAVVLTVMHTGPSYLIAFDKQTGKELWKGDRSVDAPKEAAQSYATPLNVQVDGKPMIAVMGGDYLTIHDASNGKELGRLGGFNPTSHEYFRSIASPVAQGNLIICPYARGASVTAVRMDDLAKGKGKDAIAWFRDDIGSDVPTPAAKDGRVYFISDGKQTRGLVTCVDAKTGETIWDTKLPKSRVGFSSSPLIAGDHLYITGENATTYVIGPLSAGKNELAATNEVSDDVQYTVASPTAIGDAILLRSRSHLYKIKSDD